MSNVRDLTGSIVALVTPFKDNGDVDFEALDRLVDFHLENGTDGILVLGTTGESSTMTDAEDVAVAQHVVNRVNGAIPIIDISGRGISFANDDELISGAQDAVRNALISADVKGGSLDVLRKTVRNAVSNLLWSKTHTRPLVIPVVLEV